MKKRYETITVADICDAANIGRSTFYSHYGSKDDLKRSGLQNIRKALVYRRVEPSAGQCGRQRWGFSLAMFEHARDHVHHYRAMVGDSGGALALGRIRQILAEVVRDELALASDRDSADAIAPELVVQYVVGAYMAVLTWWLDGGMKLPPERVDAMFQRLATEGIGLRLTASR